MVHGRLFLATTSAPDVSLSSRWTMPGLEASGNARQIRAVVHQGIDQSTAIVPGAG
jgi:hypothetical protein